MHAYLADPALRTAALACACIATLCWLLSVVNRNYSQVDRLWSIVPTFYVGGFAYAADFSDLRLDLMTALVALWGARLTYNFWRKGGYRPGGEDYRWPILRERLGAIPFQVFNATFIAPYQNLLLLLITLPAWAALRARAPLGWLDGVLALAFVVLLATETIADQQQWVFQADKQARRARGDAIDAEFVTTGLWRFSRHPNFFCEISIWWCVYGFSVAAGAGVVNVTLGGPILLTLLFQGSTAMTEGVTKKKYPAYADYQRRTSRLIPLPPR